MDDPRLLVDGSGHMPFHYAASQCGLYNLLHPRTNLTTFALMLTTAAAGEGRSVRNSASSDCEASGGRRSSSLSADTTPVTTVRGPKEGLWAQLRAQLRKAHHSVPHHDSPWDVRGRGVSLPGSGVGSVRSTECTLSAVSSVSHRNESAQPASELNNDSMHKAPPQLVDHLFGSQRHRPRFSYSGNILSGLRLTTHTSASSMVSPSYGDTSHTWRCELLPCQHSMCGGCAEQLLQCQEPAASICCPMCHAPVKELKPAT